MRLIGNAKEDFGASTKCATLKSPIHSQEEQKTKNSIPFLARVFHFTLIHENPPESLMQNRLLASMINSLFAQNLHSTFTSPFFTYRHSYFSFSSILGQTQSSTVQYSVQCTKLKVPSWFVLVRAVCSGFFIWTRLVHKTLLCFDVVPKNQRDSNSRIRFRFYHQTNTVDSR